MKKTIITLLLAGMIGSCFAGCGDVSESSSSSSEPKQTQATSVTKKPAAEDHGVSSELAYSKAMEMVDGINKLRRENGVPELVADEKMMEAAAVRAQELSAEFSHERPNDEAGISIIFETIPDVWYTGENIQVGTDSADSALSEFSDSDAHMKTMLSEDFSMVGIGYCVDESGHGYWCQLFAGYKE